MTMARKRVARAGSLAAWPCRLEPPSRCFTWSLGFWRRNNPPGPSVMRAASTPSCRPGSRHGPRRRFNALCLHCIVAKSGLCQQIIAVSQLAREPSCKPSVHVHNHCTKIRSRCHHPGSQDGCDKSCRGFESAVGHHGTLRRDTTLVVMVVQSKPPLRVALTVGEKWWTWACLASNGRSGGRTGAF
ncbi:hypothetical protein IWX49DRAFT_378382 [Phyllosticta citricarpa]